MLSARATGPEDLHSEVVRVDAHFHFTVNCWHDLNQSEGGVAAVGGVEGRNTDKPVNAALSLEVAVGVVALNFDEGALYACFLTR